MENVKYTAFLFLLVLPFMGFQSEGDIYRNYSLVATSTSNNYTDNIINGDGIVNAIDRGIIWSNRNKNIQLSLVGPEINSASKVEKE